MKPTKNDLEKAYQDISGAINRHQKEADGNNVLSELLQEQKRLLEAIERYSAKNEPPHEPFLHQ